MPGFMRDYMREYHPHRACVLRIDLPFQPKSLLPLEGRDPREWRIKIEVVTAAGEFYKSAAFQLNQLSDLLWLRFSAIHPSSDSVS
jgi:hypothetical protein